MLLEIEGTIKWWHILTSSSADTTTAAKYVLSKGYNRLDMQIIEVNIYYSRDNYFYNTF